MAIQWRTGAQDDALIAEMQAYARPVLYVHGDTHIFRTGRPLLNPKTQRFFENLTRLETFGWPDSAWVRVVVNPTNRELFEIHPEYAPSNSAKCNASARSNRAAPTSSPWACSSGRPPPARACGRACPS